MGAGCWRCGGQLEGLLDQGVGQGPERGKGGSHGDICRKNDPDRGNRLCKGPEAGPRLVCLRNRAIGVSGAEGARAEVEEKKEERAGPCGLTVRTWAITRAPSRGGPRPTGLLTGALWRWRGADVAT